MLLFFLLYGYIRENAFLLRKNREFFDKIKMTQ